MIIKELRKYMKENGIDYFYINTADEYLLEYNDMQNCFRYAVTGFSGSTGEALLTLDELFLFVDGRYHTQADIETNPNVVKVIKLEIGEKHIQKIAEIVEENKTFALISKTVSLNIFEQLQEKLKGKNITFKKLDANPIFNPAKKEKNIKINYFKIGLSQKEKIEKLNLADDEALLVNALDEIAYFTNLRSFDIPFSSSFYSKMIVEKDKITLFTDGKAEKKPELVKVLPLNCFENYLISINKTILFCKKNINLYNYELIKDNCREIVPSPIEKMKSIKTDDELEYIKMCYKKTDIAVNEAKKLVESGKNITEADLAKFIAKEFEKVGAKAQSFTPIAAFGKNSAIIHYKDYDNSKKLNDGELVLLDCGAYFEGGFASDITRTFYRGELSDEQKMIYEAVKQAHLKVLNSTFDTPPTAFELDKTARDMLKKYEKYGYKFSHSLGHGVGINVHEHPPILSPAESSKETLKENMVFTIEPGLYKEGVGGVRLENSVYMKKENGKYCFKSLSFVEM